MNVLPAEEHAARLALYQQGLSDGEIARQRDRTRAMITTWRHKNDLPRIFPPHGEELSPEEDARRMRWYNAGLSDIAIARAVGVTRPAITHWRRAKGLPKRGKM